jgi:hypothetical protein
MYGFDILKYAMKKFQSECNLKKRLIGKLSRMLTLQKNDSFETNKLNKMQLEKEKQPNASNDRKFLLDIFVIPLGSRWKRYFDLVLTIVCVFNVYSNAFYAANGLPHNTMIDNLIDISIEMLFLLDIFFNFFLSYKDEETFEIDVSFLSIAKRYLKKSFFFDFIAWFPIEYIFHNVEKIRIFRLLKLLRIPRLA